MSQWLYENNNKLYAGTITLAGTDSVGNLTAPIITDSTVFCPNVYVARALTADITSGNINGDTDLTGYLDVSANMTIGTDLVVGGDILLTGYLDTDANITIGTDLAVGGDADIVGNLQVTGWIDSDANISATGAIQTAAALISTVATGTAPLTVSSTTRVANLNVTDSAAADVADALATSGASVDVAAGAPGTAGQVLTLSDATTASWEDATSPTGNIDMTNITADLVTANSIVLNTELSGAGDVDIAGWINSDANISTGTSLAVGTALTVGTDATISGNLQVTGWIDSDSNISATGAIQTAAALISTVSTGTAPLTVSSTTEVSNLKSATATLAVSSSAIESATTTVNTSSATAPTSGQVLTATGDSAATWQTPAGTSIMVAAKVTLSAANIIAMYGAPVTLVAAQGAETVILMHSFSWNYNYGTVAFTGAGSGDAPTIDVAYAGHTTGGAMLSCREIKQARDSFGFKAAGQAVSGGGTIDTDDVTDITNSALTISNDTAAFADGDGTMDCYITYQIVTL